MKTGIAIKEIYDGPRVDAMEFYLGPIHDDIKMPWESELKAANEHRRELLQRCRNDYLNPGGHLSAHLPSYLPWDETMRQVGFALDAGEFGIGGQYYGKVPFDTYGCMSELLIDHFVAHVTKHTPYDDWRKIFKGTQAVRILLENHNQDWHPTDAGWCWPEQFYPAIDAGAQLCLDTGHILYASMTGARDAAEWIDRAERAFDGFVNLPIAAAHLHTVDRFGGVDHALDGFDIRPWVRRLVERHPRIVLLVETGEPRYTVADKLGALQRWIQP